MKYSDQIGLWLKDLGYTHYFYVGGGNIMHLTESLSRYLTPVPVVHEVAAGIAAEYFNEINPTKKALALVTTGPGLTNIVTAIAGAYLESRELLVIGGQVKTSDLSSDGLRSRGIQEVHGIELVKGITKLAFQFRQPINAAEFADKVSQSWTPRKGPVFLEMPLDVQAVQVEEESVKLPSFNLPEISELDLLKIAKDYNASKRPIFLIGGGVDYSVAVELQKKLNELEIPVMTTYNGADRIDGDSPFYLGRPNTWGQRSANIILQQADLIIAIGTRLGLQQTGFNWGEFGRDAVVHHIDIDLAELNKGHPRTDFRYQVDANDFLRRFLNSTLKPKQEWLEHAKKIRARIPRVEPVNKTGDAYISPYEFITQLETLTTPKDLIIPCSSGSAFTLTMQLYKQKFGQRVLSNKSLASMGYGLSGAIGACIAGDNQKRTILIEGDGGFAQNMQELGTAELNQLNLKIFIFHDQGHASIRMTQRSYFNGRYLGCDRQSGLGLPNWDAVFSAWNIPVMTVNSGFQNDPEFKKQFSDRGLAAFIVEIDPEQTYFPKISSRITATGTMESNPIDRMTPDLEYAQDLILPNGLK
jgi:acetolactate synthase-1/2/3 large subunit